MNWSDLPEACCQELKELQINHRTLEFLTGNTINPMKDAAVWAQALSNWAWFTSRSEVHLASLKGESGPGLNIAFMEEFSESHGQRWAFAQAAGECQVRLINKMTPKIIYLCNVLEWESRVGCLLCFSSGFQGLFFPCLQQPQNIHKIHYEREPAAQIPFFSECWTTLFRCKMKQNVFLWDGGVEEALGTRAGQNVL